jgi:hypothetical protein
MKLTANNCVGQEDEQAIAGMLGMMIPGAPFPTTKRELSAYRKRTLGASAAILDEFFNWMGQGGGSHWKVPSKVRVAAGASAALDQCEFLKWWLATATPSYWPAPPYETVVGLGRVAAFGSAEPGFEAERGTAAAKIADFARNGTQRTKEPLLIDDVLEGLVGAVKQRAHWFGLHVPQTGAQPGLKRLRADLGLPQLQRTRGRPTQLSSRWR